MNHKTLKNSLWKVSYIFAFALCFMVITSILGRYKAEAQLPFWILPPSAFYYGQNFMEPYSVVPFWSRASWSGASLFPPPIRQTPYPGGWYGANTGSFQLAMPAPRPVIRQAAATLTLLITLGPTAALIVYNPTILFGQPTTAVIPSALTLPSLLSGKPLIFGTAPITSSNLAIFNYVANTFLLPSGIAFYIIP